MPPCAATVWLRREHLGDARGLEARLGAAHRRAQARTAGADDHGVIGVVDDLVSGGHQAGAPGVTTVKAILRIEKIAKVPAAMVK